MNETKTYTVTSDKRAELLDLLRSLPAVLSGKGSDTNNIAEGFKARIGYTILSLIVPNFNILGRGQSGVDGTRWPPLTRSYLAYGRRFGSSEQASLKKAAGLGKEHRFAPGSMSPIAAYGVRLPNKGLLNKQQLDLWRKTYSERLRWYVKREGIQAASAHAAAIAWKVVKDAGGKTKLDVYGNRQVQILVDTGRLRGSLTPGTLTETSVQAKYNTPNELGAEAQLFEIENQRLIVGTNVRYAKYHHHGKGKRRRRFWPEQFPSSWWEQILGAGVSGLMRIGELFQGGV